MARPSNAQIEAEIAEIIDDERFRLWTQMIDRENASLPAARSAALDRKSRLKAAARIALCRMVAEELNDSTSDLAVSVEDVKQVMAGTDG